MFDAELNRRYGPALAAEIRERSGADPWRIACYFLLDKFFLNHDVALSRRFVSGGRLPSAGSGDPGPQLARAPLWQVDASVRGVLEWLHGG